MSRNSDITDIQIVLGVTPDGSWGPKSQAALDALIHPSMGIPIDVPAGEKIDDRSERAISTIHARMQPLARQLVRKAAEAGIKIIITSGTRTYAEQNDLYEQGRSKSGKIVTNARGGQSNHNFGIAIDVTVFEGASPKWDGPEYKKVGVIGESIGLDWGGRWTSIQDEPHFELRPEWAKGLSESAMLGVLRQRHDEGRDAFA